MSYLRSPQSGTAAAYTRIWNLEISKLRTPYYRLLAPFFVEDLKALLSVATGRTTYLYQVQHSIAAVCSTPYYWSPIIVVATEPVNCQRSEVRGQRSEVRGQKEYYYWLSSITVRLLNTEYDCTDSHRSCTGLCLANSSFQSLPNCLLYLLNLVPGTA